MTGWAALILALAGLTCASLPAHAGDAAPLWGYVDGAGVAHVAAERLDIR